MTMTPEEIIAASMARHPAGSANRHLALVPDLPFDPDEIPAPLEGDPILVHCEGTDRPPCLILEEGRGLCIGCGEPQALYGASYVVPHRRDDLIGRLLRGDVD